MSNKTPSVLQYLLIGTLLLLLLPACGGSPATAPAEPTPIPGPTPTPHPLSAFPLLISQLNEEKYKAENLVRQVKNDKSEGRISDVEYDEARRLYSDAEIEFNALIAGLQAGLSSRDFDMEVQKPRFEDALTKSSMFSEYIQAGYPAPTGGQGQLSSAAALVIPVLGELIDVLPDLLTEFNRAAGVKRQEMRNDLEQQKWLSFDQIS